MCLAIPMQIVERRELAGIAEVGGVRRDVGLALCPEARLGDFILVHAGYAIAVIDADEARKTLELLESVETEDPR